MPKEPWQNRAFASLGSAERSSALRHAVLTALLPGVPTSCACGGAVVLRESGSGPDWTAVCAHCTPLRVFAAAEHKPRAAPRHDKPCTVGDYDDAVRRGMIRMGVGTGLPGAPPRRHRPAVSCEQPHAWAVCGLQWPHKAVLGGYRLALPQVVVDALALGMPIRLVTDRGTPTTVYRSDDWDIEVLPRWFPVTTTAQLLDRLAARVHGLDRQEREAVRRAMTMLWARADWATHEDMRSRTRAWLQPWAKAVAWFGT